MSIKSFFRRIFWKTRKCKKCGKKVKISREDVECKYDSLLMQLCGHFYEYGYHCQNCGKYNYIPDNTLPFDIKFQLKFNLHSENRED